MRKNRLYISTLASFCKQAVSIVVGLILPRLYIQYYGSDVNGLINSITQFLGYISLLELGLRSVVSSALYKPLAEKNQAEISRIIVSTEKFFRRIAIILLIYCGVLVVVYPLLISKVFDFGFTAFLIIAIAISSFGQYYFGITKSILLNADQKSYVPYLAESVVLFINLIFSVFLIIAGVSVQLVKIISSMIFLIRPLILSWYVRGHYIIDYEIEVIEEPIKQKKNGIAQHVAFTVFKNTDTAVLTLFSTLKMVSVYSIYGYVVEAVSGVFQSLMTSVTATLGNILAKKEYDLAKEFFQSYIWLVHLGAVVLFSVAYFLIIPFVKLYTRGITDADYIAPEFAGILLFAYFVDVIRTPYNQVILAIGHYKETQNSAWIEMIINIVVSLVFVRKMDLIGVAIGTLCAMLYRMCFFVWYLSKHILNIKISYFARLCLTDIIVVMFIGLEKKWLPYNANNYFEWIIYAMIATFLFAFTAVIVNAIINRHILKKCFFMLKQNRR